MAARVTAEQLQEARARLRLRPLPGSGGQPATAAATNSAAAGHDGFVQAESTVEREQGAESAAAASFSVTLMFMDGSDFQVEVCESSRVDSLKSQISDKLGVTSARVRLIFDSAMLEVNETIASYGIADGA